VIVLIFLRLP